MTMNPTTPDKELSPMSDQNTPQDDQDTAESGWDKMLADKRKSRQAERQAHISRIHFVYLRNASLKSSASFFKLPEEIRLIIYFALARPDTIDYGFCTPWFNALGCTKVLTLCKKIYDEARPVFDLLVPVLDFHGGGRRLFRQQRAHGTPLLFASYSVETSNYIPPPLTELSFVSVRKLQVDLKYPCSDDDHTEETFLGLKKEFKELELVLAKSSSLLQLHFTVQTTSYSKGTYDYDLEKLVGVVPNTSNDIVQMTAFTAPLLRTAGRKGIRVTATENKHFNISDDNVASLYLVHDYKDPLVHLITMVDAGSTPASGAPRPQLPHSTRIEPEEDVHGDWANGVRLYQTMKPYDQVAYPHRPFTLTPECRACYAIFALDSELKTHLRKNPKHKIPFTKKTYNPVDRLADPHRRKHKCRVCAEWFDTRREYDQHVTKYGHSRGREMGIVPKFRCDNAWFKTGTAMGPKKGGNRCYWG